MKKRNRFLTALSGIVMACLFLLPISTTDIKAAEYEIVFKAGSHGSVDGQKEVSYHLSTNDYSLMNLQYQQKKVMSLKDGANSFLLLVQR